ncbi:MAG: flavin reductase, partial [Bradyrhizobium sp.]|nr:flavin reductase [Bradyrhizobium sp.]
MNSIVRLMPDATALQPDFRSAMRQLVGGVSVITVGRGDEITGMTVSSLSSLSVDPPSV